MTRRPRAATCAAIAITALSLFLRCQPKEEKAPALPFDVTISVDPGTVLREIPRELFGTNVEWRWNGNLLWVEKEKQADPRMVGLTRDLGVSMIRFPGGIYSDLYHWKQAIGPYHLRPELLHEPGKEERSRPLFGTDEALQFARDTGSELLITVNAGTGTAEEAAEWVRYVNRDGLRVRYWEVGNELYIRDGSPVSNATTMPPQQYAAKFLEFARAMRAADPRIRIGAITGLNQGRYALVGYPEWNSILLKTASAEIDFLSIHNAYAPLLRDDDADVRAVYRAMYAAPLLTAGNLRAIADQVRTLAPGRAAHIRLAVTEWGPFFQTDFGNRFVDHNKTLGSALFVGSMMKTLIESPETDLAAFWLLNDVSVLGWIGSRNDDFPPAPEWFPTARYHALQMFTKHFGTRLVPSKVASPTFSTEAVGMIDAVASVPLVDAVASLDASGDRLFVIVINKDFDRPAKARIETSAFVSVAGQSWTLSGKTIDSHTGTRVIRVPGLDVVQASGPLRTRMLVRA